MKYINLSLFFVFFSMHAGRLPDLFFRETLRNYDPDKDVGRKHGHDYVFGRHASFKSALPKNFRDNAALIVHQQRMHEYEQRVKVPPIQRSRLRFIAITAEPRTISKRY